jgi:hypothetical protein
MIYPAAKHLSILEGTLDVSKGLYFIHTKDSKIAEAAFKSPLYELTVNYERDLLFFKHDPSLKKEAYGIQINQEGVVISYSTPNGLFYGVKSLIQLHKIKKGKLPYLTLIDEPDLEVRGFMLDISRNKVPKLETLKKYVDLLADLKYNHFELYVEGFSFFYPSFEHLYTEGMTPITPKEYRSLEKYAKDRMIDLVPCHNGLGHMTAWLKHYPELAVMPDGMFFWGSHREPSTINPLDERSLELVKSFYNDTLKYTKSQFFNINLDEPYELGHGKTEEEAKKIGVGELYLNYVLKLYDFMKENKKTPLIWGDVLNHHPEALVKLPKDLIFVDWGYDYDYPFHKTLKQLGDLGVKFMAAPGTSSWNSITGRRTTMFENIRQVVLHTKLNKGLGMLLTDWGDNGHLQMLPASIPGIVYGGLESWHARVHNQREVREFINLFAVDDLLGRTGHLMLDLGTYVDYETSYTYNASKLVSLFTVAKHLNPHDLQGSFYMLYKDHPYGTMTNFNFMLDKMTYLETAISKLRFSRNDDSLIKSEMLVSVRLVKSMMMLIRMHGHGIKTTEFYEYQKWLAKHYAPLMKEFKKLWLKRNKNGGLEESMKSLIALGEVVKMLQNLTPATSRSDYRNILHSDKQKTTLLS